MDYEKIYNNALERAKHAIEDCGDNQGRKEMIYGIFPELAESKDERIRKELIKFVSDVKSFAEDGRESWAVREEDIEMCKRFLAYLEKQKEQIINHKGLHKGSLRHVDNPTKWMKEDDMEREQNPAEWSEEDEDKVAQYLHDKDGGMLWSKATEIAEDILGMIRPQPHWKPSEEQMKLLKEAEYALQGKDCHNRFVGFIWELKKLM